MRSRVKIVLAGLLLAALTGCAEMDSIRLSQDTPADIEQLLQQNEFARIRQLTGRYPSIDSAELQELVTARELSYVETSIADARSLESEHDLMGAVQLLSEAVQRVPHSVKLREMRNALEKERVQELKHNERERLITRANYMLDEQALYEQQANLTQPTIVRRWENLRNQKEAAQLSGQLLEHGEYALLQNDLDGAENCLQLSLRLEHSAAAEEMLSRLQSLKSSRQQVEKKKAIIQQAKHEQKIQRSQKQQTKALLAETQQALEHNRLQEARAAFVQIPAANSNNSEVMAVKDDLHVAVSKHVAQLIASGDALYRADKVNQALQQWMQARSLDPENQQLQERIDRANKVLARLEELKRQQH